jgi:hypothetical protein
MQFLERGKLFPHCDASLLSILFLYLFLFLIKWQLVSKMQSLVNKVRFGVSRTHFDMAHLGFV